MPEITSLEVDKDLTEMFAGLLEEAGSATFDEALWAQFEELGLKRLTGSEAIGGSGASWAEAQALLTQLARSAVRSPYAEHDLIAGHVTDELGLTAGSLMTLAQVRAEGDFLIADRTAWASAADTIVVMHDGAAASLNAADLEITPGFNNIGEPRDTVKLSAAQFAAAGPKPVTAELLAQLQLKQAMVRAISVTAALEQALEVTIKHVTSRNQFGRQIAKFQAVQALVSDIAAETALAQAATDAALLEALGTDWQSERLEFLVAVARSSVGHAASTVARNAHQAHGAIGTTIEHELHNFTRAALAWRGEYGSVNHWDERVNEIALEAPEIWSLIAD